MHSMLLVPYEYVAQTPTSSPYVAQTPTSLKSARAAGAPSTLLPPQSLKSTLAWGSADSWQTESRAAFTNPTLSAAPQPSYVPAPLLVPLPPGYALPPSGFAPPPPPPPPAYVHPPCFYPADYPGYFPGYYPPYGYHPPPYNLPAAPQFAPTPLDAAPAVAASAPAPAPAAAAVAVADPAVPATDEVTAPRRPSSAATAKRRPQSAPRRRTSPTRSPPSGERPVFFNYGHANIKPAIGGYCYGDYMATHNAKAGSTVPLSPRLAASTDMGTMQTHFMEADIRRSAWAKGVKPLYNTLQERRMYTAV